MRELGTERLLDLTRRSASNRFTILSLARVEFRSAIRRREKNGEVPPIVATELIDAFKNHLETKFAVQILNDFVLDLSTLLIDRHFLRAFDAVQLAGYIALKSAAGLEKPIFTCSDSRLLEAAKSEGALILDPTDD